MRPILKFLKRASSGGAGALRRLPREDSGLSAMELALIAPFLAGLLIGLVDLGTTFTRQMGLANAVRAGTQFAMVRRPIAGELKDIRLTVSQAAPQPEPASRVLNVVMVCRCASDSSSAPTCDPANDCGGGDVQHFVSIALEEQHELILNYPWINNPLTVGDYALIRLN